MKLWQTILKSPYTFGLLVGLYPILFYISNNWFMFKPSQSLVLIGMFSLITFVGLSVYFVGLSWFVRMTTLSNPERIIHRLFVFLSILVLAYLLRQTFLEMVSNDLVVFLVIVVLVAGVLAWFIPGIQIYRLNSIVMILCLLSVGHGFVSIITTETNTLLDRDDELIQQTIYGQVSFSKSPNVYYIVPDAYPNREALETIFDIDNTEFYQKLESFGFAMYHSVFSNYMYTLSSISALFSMEHHYYQGSVGNFELLHSRELIAGKHNPVVQIFKRNGYQVHYIHQKEYIFMKGCFIDLCEPNVFWGEFIDILIPEKIKPILSFGIDRSLEGLERKILQHIEKITSQETPHFLYVHMLTPSHSIRERQTVEELGVFRKRFAKKINSTNQKISRIVERILMHDPNALIIINADHGAWGFGAYVWGENDSLDGLPDNLIALDQLGAHLAIRWPDGVPNYDQDIRTNVNLFRYIFAYLSGKDEILATKVPDHGYVMMGKGNEWKVAEVVQDGKPRERMLEMGTVK